MPAEPGAGGAAKRALDVVGAGLALALLSPVVLAVAAAVRVTLGAPVLFRQERVGLGEKGFTIYKFRTMHHGAGSDAERLTRFGRFLRSTSLDELPQLWNVLRGDMSLVGPRPLLPEYLPRYSPRQALRHRVRPGITGWSAVRGRNALGWDEQLEADAWYVENRSFLLDLRILGLTVVQVLRRHGVSQPGQATREPFRGGRGGEGA
jgi:lipopolysaccharide/colanic/teichoic acid biosynthesis glycosyltransferase